MNGSASTQRSTVGLVRTIADDAGTLVRKEVELARIELVDALNARLRAAIAAGAAALMGMFVLVFLLLAAEAALNMVMAEWLARLVVAGAATLIIGPALLFARARMKAPSIVPEATIRTMKEDVEWARQQLKR